MKKLTSTSAGYTLVEIAISLMVLGVGFLSVLSLFVAGIKWSKETTARSTAVLAARSAAEDYLVTSPIGTTHIAYFNKTETTKTIADMQYYYINPATMTVSPEAKSVSGYYIMKKSYSPPNSDPNNIFTYSDSTVKSVWIGAYQSKGESPVSATTMDKQKPVFWCKMLIWRP